MASVVLAAGAAAVLGGMYVDAKTGLSQDLRVLSAGRLGASAQRTAEHTGKLSLFSVLERNRFARPSKPSIFYVPTGKEETWLDTYNHALRFSSFLLSQNVQQGDVVAINYTNKPDILHLWMGLAAIGASPAFINYTLVGDALLHCLRVSGAKLLLFDEDVSERVSPLLNEIKSLGIQPKLLDKEQLGQIGTLPLKKPDFNPASNKPGDIGCIFYTSGTTGYPKAAIFTLGRWWYVGEMMGGLLRLGKEDRFYTCMPLYHGTGMSCFVQSLFKGGCLCLGLRFSASRYWDEVRLSDATLINYIGETCRYLLATPASPRDKEHKVHTAYGLGCRTDVWQKLRERFGIRNVMEFYGSSEGLGTALNYNSGPLGVGAVGRDGALQRFYKRNDWILIRVDPDTEEPIRSPNGLCIQARPDEPGELLWRVWDKSAVPGYYQDRNSTAKKLLENVKVDGDTWFRSGDLLSKSSDGYWFFIDRLGDTFRWRAENVSTMEVTEALSVFENLQDISVYGVALPRHEGRAGCAAIVIKPGTTFNFEEFTAFAKSLLPKYAVPLFIRVLDKMPTTENNKLMKGPLKKEGVDPAKLPETASIFWLKGGYAAANTYVPFTASDWESLSQGKASL